VKGLTDGHKRKVNAFSLSRDHRMWSAGDDGAICVWDADRFELIKRLEGHQGAVYGVTAMGDFMWTCGWDTSIRIWNITNFDCVCKLMDYHSDCVSSIQAVWGGNGTWHAWTGSWDKSVCTFRVSNIHNMSTTRALPSASVPNVSSILSAINSPSASSVSQSLSTSLSTSISTYRPVSPPPAAPIVIQKVNSNNAVSASTPYTAPSMDDKVGELLQKKDELIHRRRALEERKQELEEKKQELAKRRQELMSDMSHQQKSDAVSQ